MQQKEVFALNVTNEAQTLRHNMIAQMAVLPVMPGGYVLTRNDSVIVPAGAAFRIPMGIWNTGSCAYKRPWTTEISEEEFFKMAVPPDDPAAPIIAELEQKVADLEAEAERLRSECVPTDAPLGEPAVVSTDAVTEVPATDGAPNEEKPAEVTSTEPQTQDKTTETSEAHAEVTTETGEVFPCPSCGREFTTRAGLARHRASCNGK